MGEGNDFVQHLIRSRDQARQRETALREALRELSPAIQAVIRNPGDGAAFANLDATADRVYAALDFTGGPKVPGSGKPYAMVEPGEATTAPRPTAEQGERRWRIRVDRDAALRDRHYIGRLAREKAELEEALREIAVRDCEIETEQVPSCPGGNLAREDWCGNCLALAALLG
jgi:hypothetical protein